MRAGVDLQDLAFELSTVLGCNLPLCLGTPVHQSVVILKRGTAPCFSKRERTTCSVTLGPKLLILMLI